jgi:hypothetical protein
VLRRINWRVFAILLVAGLVGVLAVVPFMLELMGSGGFGRAPVPDVPLPVLVALALLQNGVLLALTIVVGMTLSERVGLDMRLIRAWPMESILRM